MRDDGNAFFWTLLEPSQKFDAPFATMFVRFLFVAIKNILLIDDFGKVKVGKFGGNLGNRPSSIADIMPPSFPIFFSDQSTRRRDGHTRLVFPGPFSRAVAHEECNNYNNL